MKARKLILAFLILSCISGVVGQGIGTVPGYQHLGTVERGETVTFEVYITSTAQENFRVSPSYSTPRTSSVFEGPGPIKPDQVSEEDIVTWLDFTEETYEVTPSNPTTVRLQDGVVNADAVIEMRLNVPQDAEPGYHMGTIRLDPEFGDSESGFGTSVVAQSVPQFSFKVPGNANRNVEATDVQVIREGDDRAQLTTTVRNYGDVTTTVRGGELRILTMNGQQLSQISATNVKLAPGETGQVTSYWDGNLNGGRYQVAGDLNYMTGRATFSEVFNLPQQIQVRSPEEVEGNQSGVSPAQEEPVPIWLVVMSLVILGVLMYSFEIDPVWIIAIIGFLGIAAYIVTSPISNIYLAGLLISAGLLTYYGLM